MQDTPEQEARFATLMTSLSDYYGKELSDGVIDVYWNSLKVYEFADIRRAAWAHVQNPDTSGSFLPKVSEFVKMMQGDSGDQGAVAWSKVDKAVRGVGCYHDVVFDDAIIHRVLADMGGWLWLNQQDDKAWPFVGNDFKTRYKGYRMRGETPEYPPVLIGMANAHNAKEAIGGFKFLPMLIGDQEKAKCVMSTGTSAPLLQMRPAGQLTQDIKQLGV